MSKNQLKSLDLVTELNHKNVDDYVKERGVPVLSRLSPAAPAPSPNTKMALEVPDYVPGRLRDMAYEQNCTIRYLILEALHKAGCEIKPQDRTKDGRRQTRK